MPTNPPSLIKHARAMRREPTEAEVKLWRILRGRRLAALKFRRQTPIPPYIADFVCFEHRLVIEADGSQHAESHYDQERDAFLAAQGFVVLRFWNHDILQRPRTIEDTILARCGLPF
ncbi:endonuclease domain-containing protein [Rhodoblastus sp.]|uniref:endonuclease domain-containing protein n=2 Tax=Rhodoblastus sp. TaxID=1962975 RepID=UPI003F9B3A02